MNNMFVYSPKELTTDAFLAWVFLEFNNNCDLNKSASIFFYKLGLCQDHNSTIGDIEISRQEQSTDLIIRYKNNGEKNQALFENKTYTTVHSNQLIRYKKKFSNFTYYKYLKLGFVSYAEAKEVRNAGYEVIDVYKLFSALKTISNKHFLIEHYKEFLQSQYIDIQDDIKKHLIINNKYELFSNGQAQQFFLSKLHASIDGLNNDLKFKFSANVGGTPWTQLDIAKRIKAYGEESEYLFWRIDKRSKGYYLRLNQYSCIDNQYAQQKTTNLKLLRSLTNPLFQKYGLILGKASNKGTMESEVEILFFEDNKLGIIFQVLPELSRKIYEIFISSIKWV